MGQPGSGEKKGRHGSRVPHETPGLTGTGAPVAPPDWKWRCGNRKTDMYFYTPSGKMVRSRTELQAVLDEMPDAPPAGDFCWKVTSEIINTGVWNKEENIMRAPRKSIDPKADKVGTPKQKSSNVEQQDTSPKKAKIETESSPAPPASPITPQGPNPPQMAAGSGLQFSQVQPLAIRAPGTIISKKVSISRRKGKNSGNGDPEAQEPSFKEILSEPSSFRWLQQKGTHQKFLDEAGKLDELGGDEVRELRQRLVGRDIQTGNISKYTNSVLRVFARILTPDGLGPEPSSDLGKVQLVDLCFKLSKS